MSVSVNGTNGLTFNDGSTQNTSAFVGGFAMRNRIINGAMVIDQRNAGASTTPTSSATGFATDRWALNVSQNSKFSAQQSSAFVGFTNSLLITSLSAYAVTSGDYFMVDQNIEGFNTADLGWGTANAQTVTLSFKVKSSLTGTFGGVISNSANNRSYPFSYTISSANTETSISVTIAGDTSGTWLTTNGTGIRVRFSMGVGSTYTGTGGAWAGSTLLAPTGSVSVVGTNGATWQVTGVQLEKGSTATSFDYRPYGTELSLCQRYYYKVIGASSNSSLGVGYAASTTSAVITTSLPVTMRANPTALEQSGTASHYAVGYLTTSAVCTSVPTFNSANPNTATSIFPTSGITAGHGVRGINDNTSGYLAWSSEL